jgi:hypothetical protein
MSQAGALLMVLTACVDDGTWFTPQGVPLGEVDCTSPAPLDGSSGREICLARVIPETPEEVLRCKAAGGRTGPVSRVDRRFACNYRNQGKGF